MAKAEEEAAEEEPVEEEMVIDTPEPAEEEPVEEEDLLGGLALFFSFQGLADILYNVIRSLDPYAEPDHGRIHPCFHQLFIA